MVQQAQKNTKTNLTAFSQEGLAPETLAHLERDRWPEFERELRLRRNRKLRFALCTWRIERPRWAWQIGQCRKWDEIKRVLNKHNVAHSWKHRWEVIEIEGGDGEIYRPS